MVGNPGSKAMCSPGLNQTVNMSLLPATNYQRAFRIWLMMPTRHLIPKTVKALMLRSQRARWKIPPVQTLPQHYHRY